MVHHFTSSIGMRKYFCKEPIARQSVVVIAGGRIEEMTTEKHCPHVTVQPCNRAVETKL